MKKAGCTVLSHGATGRGNDQVRGDLISRDRAPVGERGPDGLSICLSLVLRVLGS